MSLRKDLMITNVLNAKGLPPLSHRPGRNRSAKDFKPTYWNKYFHNSHQLNIEGNQFNVYEISGSGPLLVLLHGGGFSALTWALFSKEIVSLVECHVLAIDLRGHGNTETSDDTDLSALTMAKDVADVISLLFPNTPPVILMGHSMGGAIAVHAVHNNFIPSAIALIVIDVVEGTAMDALASMQTFLKGRPSSFKNIQEAIRWCVSSGQVKNVESAQVSVPGQIKNIETNTLAANETISIENTDTEEQSDEIDARRAAAIPETIQEDEDVEFSPPKPKTKGKYTWRIDLCKTEKYWSGWFKGLSEKFIASPVQKLLLLANIDRLDKNLMVGQMQGKFSVQVLAKVGHAVHEDDPSHVAEIVATFLVRNKFTQPLTNFSTQLQNIGPC